MIPMTDFSLRSVWNPTTAHYVLYIFTYDKTMFIKLKSISPVIIIKYPLALVTVVPEIFICRACLTTNPYYGQPTLCCHHCLNNALGFFHLLILCFVQDTVVKRFAFYIFVLVTIYCTVDRAVVF